MTEEKFVLVSCPHCGAEAGELCISHTSTQRRILSTCYRRRDRYRDILRSARTATRLRRLQIERRSSSESWRT